MISFRSCLPAVLLVSAACSDQKASSEVQAPAPTTPPPVANPSGPGKLTATPKGDAYGFRLEANAFTYCDALGPHKLDLVTGKESPGGQACPKPEDANTACSGLAIDASVRSPPGESNDMIDVGARSFPVKGRVHDCAANGKSLVVLTGSGALLIDTESGVVKQLSEQGGSRVAAAAGWVAWTEGATVIVAPAK